MRAIYEVNGGQGRTSQVTVLTAITRVKYNLPSMGKAGRRSPSRALTKKERDARVFGEHHLLRGVSLVTYISAPTK